MKSQFVSAYRVLVLCAITVSILIWFFYAHLTAGTLSRVYKHFTTSVNYSVVNSRHMKKILFWNTLYGDPYFAFGQGQDPFVKAKCPESRCYTSDDRYLLTEDTWDAIVFNFNAYDTSVEIVPTKRSAKQRYIFFMLEAPSVARIPLEQFHNFFNWTMTYRSDSDIPYPHSWIASKPIKEETMSQVTKWRKPTLYDGPDVASGKNKMAAWFVSHCATTSKREELVQELAQYIPVHTYGHCGNWSCPWDKFDLCTDKLDKEYMFYLAFENSLCRDYVTEKFFNMLRINVRM